MKHNRRMNVRVKSLIYSGAVLAALAPAMETEAKEAETPDTGVQAEESALVKENRSLLLEILSTQEDMLEAKDVSLLRLMEITQTLHINGEYEAAQSLYRVMDTYAELDDTVKAYLHTNEQHAVNESAPIDMTLTEEQQINYTNIILLSKSEVNEVLDLLINAENSTESVVALPESQADVSDEDEDNSSQEEQLLEEEGTASQDLETEEIETVASELPQSEEAEDNVKENTEESSEEDIKKAGNDTSEDTQEKDEPVTKTTEKKGAAKQVSLMSISSTSKADALYNTSVNSGSVTEAWYTAVEGYTKYPNDKRFEYAIEKAAVRSLDYADKLEGRGDFESALAYFGRTLDSPWLSDALKKRATNSMETLEAALMETSSSSKADDLYDTSINSGSVTEAWYT
ncbi:MAG: hypothetical protein ABS873_05920, partial [Alkalibacterium sp.]